MKMIEYSKIQYNIFRATVGLYMSWFFFQLIPYQKLIFGQEGAFHSAEHLLFPQLLTFYPNDLFYSGFLYLMIFAGLSLSIGVLTRFWSLILFIGFVSFVNYVPYFRWPSEGFIGLLLLSLLIISPSKLKCDKKCIEVNPWLILAMGTILSLGYSFSGVIKYQSELWQNGVAMQLVLENPFAFTGLFSKVISFLIPEVLLKHFSLFVVGIQATALPMYFAHRITRKYSWLFLFLMHVSIFFLVDLRVVTVPMIAMHVLIFNPNWFKPEISFIKKLKKGSK